VRFVATADLQISNNRILGRDRLPVYEELLKDLLVLCKDCEVGHLFLLGDVIDAKNSPPREVLLLVYRWLRRALKRKVKVHWLRGNHESPSRSRPHDSLMELFSEMCHVILKPETIFLDSVAISLLPWYLPEEFVDYSILTAEVDAGGARRILMSHVATREGQVQPGKQASQKVSTADLLPEKYDLVLLGDYHAHQFLGKNICYLGAPIPHTFGDWGIEGPWLIEVTGEDISMQVLPLIGYPRFCQWEIQDKKDLDLKGYREEDYNRIFTHPSLMSLVESRYPDAEVRPISKQIEVDLSGSRISVSDLRDPLKVCSRYLDVVYPSMGKQEKKQLLKVAKECLESR
jgi:DNA repair exonuclease SbcCD nuclease subunit